ncbi:MAG: deoxyribonuclease V [Pseudomonadota bacterium]|nr:deoxyribonuclease V [Pseudomonadota bacterium]
MKTRPLHSWDIPREDAVPLQNDLRSRLILADPSPALGISHIAGADVSYDRHSDLFFAVAVLLSYPDLTVREETQAMRRVRFPYVPGLLSFREGPILLEALEKLSIVPDAVMFDGHGIAHPRGFGLACHLGLWLDRPSIGCAKSRLVGDYRTPGLEAGDDEPLVHKERIVGVVLRTKRRVRPVFVSPGHRIGISGARDIVLSCCRGYRLPEPLRQAHLAVNRLRRTGGDR